MRQKTEMTSLNRNELETLRILWGHGELKPADIQVRFAWPIENATLRSVLVNLVAKRHVARRMRGKAFFYTARVPRTTMLQGLVQHLAHVFTGGSNHALVAHLVETGDIKAVDLAKLQEIANKNEAAKSRRKK
jgi:BlaI family penicillinase repressor